MTDPPQGLFVRVPKTASTSIESILGKYPQRVLLNSRCNILPRRKWHRDGLSRIWMETLGVETWRRYFVFAFVSNPYDRAVSSWQHVRRLKQKGETITRHRAMKPDESDDLTFGAFLRLLEDDALVGQAKWHSTEQAIHVSDKSGDIAVDYLGRFESLQADFDLVCDTLGIPPSRLPVLNRSGKQGDYRAHFDQARQSIVYRIYAADFELFDYSTTL